MRILICLNHVDNYRSNDDLRLLLLCSLVRSSRLPNAMKKRVVPLLTTIYTTSFRRQFVPLAMEEYQGISDTASTEVPNDLQVEDGVDSNLPLEQLSQSKVRECNAVKRQRDREIVSFGVRTGKCELLLLIKSAI